jgi:hypothetical protein
LLKRNSLCYKELQDGNPKEGILIIAILKTTPKVTPETQFPRSLACHVARLGMKLPFSIFKRADRPYYLVKFKNSQNGSYLPPISTKKKTEDEAVQIAFEWLKDGIPKKNKVIPIKKYSLRALSKEAD